MKKLEKQVVEFRQQERNQVLDGDGFFISYNPYPGARISFFVSDDDSAETALVKKDDFENKFRILNGDYRESYKKLVPLGFEACLEFYNTMSVEHDSSWSTHHLSEKGD